MKKLVLVLAIAGLIIASLQAMAAVPQIGISGLSGASHWLWLEGENASTASSGSPVYSYIGYPWYSGMSEGLSNNPSLWWMSWNGANSKIGWNGNLPAAMSAPKVLVQMLSEYTMESFDVKVDGIASGSGFVAAAGWAESGVMSAVSAGAHSLVFDASSYGYTELKWDGFLIYDGDISAAGHPTTPGYAPGTGFAAANPSWMQANMTPNSWRTITGASFTPTFSVTGAAGGASYWISKNGVVSAYTPGTAITESGTYRVWAEAYGTAGYERSIAGADFQFSAVPEPGSILALGSGLVGLVGFAIRRRR
jgi:hypothetical protein